MSSRAPRVQLGLSQLEAREVPSMTPIVAEQVFLERLNDARANPAAYGQSIGVDLSYIAPSMPLAFDERLIEATRLHSQDMNANNFFSHTGSDGGSPWTRMNQAGYSYTSAAESIAAGYTTPELALRGLIIDAGVPSLGHRNHLLANGSGYQHREIGIGIVQNGSGNYRNYYSIDSGSNSDVRPYLTGTVYSDTNGNQKYDAGEGLSGVTLTTTGATATTWATGGYSLRVSGAGSYTVTASGGGLSGPITQTVTVGASNVRLNFNSANPPVDTVGARVTASSFTGATAGTFDKVRLTFNEPVTPATFTTADVVSLTGPGGAITPTGVAAVAGSNNTQFDVTFAAQSTLGTYSVTVGPDVRDAANNLMNQNQNSTNGEVPGDRFTGSANLTLNSAAFVGTNTTLQGSWRNAIGTDGHQIAQHSAALPSYATVAMSGQSNWTWSASTADGRALQKPAPATDRIAATWYAGNSFDVTVTVAGTQPRRVGFYLLDWDNLSRSQRVDVLDPAGNTIDTQTVSQFANGKYLSWDVTGQITFRFTKLAGPNAVVSGLFFDNPTVPPPPPPGDTTGARVTAAVFSGSSSANFNRVRLTFNEGINASSFTTTDVASLSGPGGSITATGVTAVAGSNNTQFDVTFATQTAAGNYSATVGPSILDAAGNAMDQNQNGTNGEASADQYVANGTLTMGSQATYVSTDTTTQGSWRNTYGLDGYSLSQSSAALPSYAQMTLQNAANWTWAGSTTNGRALQKAAPATDRLAAAWYGSQVDVNVSVTDGQTHRVRLYFLDWDSQNRSQRVDVIDTATQTVLDTRTISGFSGGQYLSWDVAGSVTFRVTRLAGPNAVVSGVFFG